MGRSRFVAPGTTRLTISDDDWFEVKDRLSYGEEQRLAGAMTPSMTPGARDTATKVEMDWGAYSIERLLVWVTDWSFEDDTGRQLKVNRDTVFQLDSDTVTEMDAALEAHIRAEEEKKQETRILTVSRPR